MTSRLAVLGAPIDHSLSPEIHQAAYAFLGLDWVYTRKELRENELAPFLESLDESWLGFSLTMPLKSVGYKIATNHSEDARITGLTNTLIRRDQGWYGDNTDVEGLRRALREAVPDTVTQIIIIGSGATSKSALLASARAFPKASIILSARNENAVREVVKWAAALGINAISQSLERLVLAPNSLTISTVPGTAQPELLSSSLHDISTAGTLFDIAYSPWPSAFASKWKQHDLLVLSGIEMLFEQAFAQIELFIAASGKPPIQDRAAVIAAMRAALPAR